MSVHQLPAIFGNPVLQNFVEVIPPEAISWLPRTVGWAWLGAALLLVALRYAWRWLHNWYRNRYRLEARARLRQLALAGGNSDWLPELNKLLKLTALAAFPREQVASLSGTDWVDFLTRHCPVSPFSEEQGRLLADGAYRCVTVEDITRQQLLAASLQWIRDHQGMPHV